MVINLQTLLNLDVILAIFFSLVTFGVAIYSLKVYSISQARTAKLFGIGFLLIAIAYILWAMLNIFVLSQTLTKLNYLFSISPTSESFIVITLFIGFFLAGLSMLAYTAIKKEKRSLFILITTLAYFAVGMSRDIAFSFFLITSIILIFITVSYFREYSLNRNKTTLTIAIAFLLLTFSNIEFLMSSIDSSLYNIGYITGLIAYLLILISLTKIMRKSKTGVFNETLKENGEKKK